MALGGYRPGSGRKPGKADLPKIHTYFTKEELVIFVNNLKARAEKSDKIAVFLAEQVWGKAPQTIDANMTGELTITFDSALSHVISPPSEKDSGK